MSNQISWSSSFSVQGVYAPGSILTNQTTVLSSVGASAGIITTSSSALTDIPLQSVTTVGYIVLTNLDSVNAVDFGIDSSGFVAIGTVKANETAIFRYKSGVTPAVKAQAGSPQISYLLLNS